MPGSRTFWVTLSLPVNSQPRSRRIFAAYFGSKPAQTSRRKHSGSTRNSRRLSPPPPEKTCPVDDVFVVARSILKSAGPMCLEEAAHMGQKRALFTVAGPAKAIQPRGETLAHGCAGFAVIPSRQPVARSNSPATATSPKRRATRATCPLQPSGANCSTNWRMPSCRTVPNLLRSRTSSRNHSAPTAP